MQRHPPDNPKEWMRLANDDLAAAGLGPHLVSLEILCFHAQQAAEKALKAALIDRGVLNSAPGRARNSSVGKRSDRKARRQ